MKHNTKKVLSLILAMLMLLSVVPITASAAETVASGTCGDNLTWTLDTDGTLTVSGTGAMVSYSYSNYPWYDYRSSIKKVIFEDGVTSIGHSAFYSYSNLTDIFIGKSVESIDDSFSFYVLKNLVIDENNPHLTTEGKIIFSKDKTYLIRFYDRSALSYTVPESVKHIGSSAFSGCYSLENIEIPDSVISVGESAFSNTGISRDKYETVDGLTYYGNILYSRTKYVYDETGSLSHAYEYPDHITVRDGTRVIAGGVFQNIYTNTTPKLKATSISLPDSLVGISDYAFTDLRTLASIEIPDAVIYIGDHAFDGCNSLTNVTCGNSVESIGNYAFNDCAIENINLPDTLKSIGAYAFAGCNFKTVKLPSAITRIEDGTFYSCDFSEIEISENVTYIGNKAFCYSDLTSIIIPEKVTYIGDDAFSYTDITSITLPDSVTYVGEAFDYCSELISIDISASVEYFANRLFCCEKLTDINVAPANKHYSSTNGILFNKDKTELIKYPIGKNTTKYTIPSTVQKICDYAFEDCETLTEIVIPNSVTHIGWVAFNNTGLTSLYIPDSVIDIDYAFGSCKNLTDIHIPDSIKILREDFSDTAYYKNEANWTNDVLYAGNCLLGIKNSDQTEFIVPYGTVAIASRAFFATNFTSVVLPDTVKSILRLTYTHCKNLECIKFSDSVEYIETVAFHNSNQFKTIYYAGSADSWDNIVYNLYTRFPGEESLDSENFHAATVNFVDCIYTTDYKHAYTDAITTAPTHTEEGVRTYTCICKDTYSEPVAKLEHTYNKVVTAPTCEDGGYTTYTCATCGDSYVADETAALGHSAGAAATCTEDQTCTVCGETLTAAFGHAYVGTVTTNPTCTEVGVKTYVCSNDVSHTYTEAVAATGHDYNTVVTAPTCSEKGFTTYTCATCGDSYATDYVGATGHSHKATVTKPATHTETGVRTYTCSACGDSYTESIAKTAKHTYTAEVLEEAQCKKAGKMLYICECGDSYTEKIPELGHIDVDDDSSCDRCGIKVCSCMCHQTGFMGFIWKIVKIFWQLFGMNPVCECGKAHY